MSLSSHTMLRCFYVWFKLRHKGLYEKALAGDEDATYIQHEMRAAYRNGYNQALKDLQK